MKYIESKNGYFYKVGKKSQIRISKEEYIRKQMKGGDNNDLIEQICNRYIKKYNLKNNSLIIPNNRIYNKLKKLNELRKKLEDFILLYCFYSKFLPLNNLKERILSKVLALDTFDAELDIKRWILKYWYDQYCTPYGQYINVGPEKIKYNLYELSKWKDDKTKYFYFLVIENKHFMINYRIGSYDFDMMLSEAKIETNTIKLEIEANLTGCIAV